MGLNQWHILSTHGGKPGLNSPGGERTQEEFFVLETKNTEKRRKPLRKNHVFTRHRGGYQLTVIFPQLNNNSSADIYVYVFHLFHIPIIFNSFKVYKSRIYFQTRLESSFNI